MMELVGKHEQSLAEARQRLADYASGKATQPVRTSARIVLAAVERMYALIDTCDDADEFMGIEIRAALEGRQ